MTRDGRHRTVWIIAADVSADQNAARLAAALLKLAPNLRIVGAGGNVMREAGVNVAIDSGGVSMVGPPDSLRALRALARVSLGLMRLMRHDPPDVAVLVDNETLNLLLARRLRRRGIPTVFFFPPQVWFWGRWRMRWILPATSLVLSAFREEAELYKAAGAETLWIGHPLRDAVRVRDDPAKAVRAIGLDPSRPLVVLMPGSRPQELRAHCDLMLTVARILRDRDPRLQFALPLASEGLRAQLEKAVRAASLPDTVIYAPDSFAVLSQARAVLQCSGTATVETGLLGIPSVIVYRCSRLKHLVARAAMYVNYVGMVNILLGEMVQPEFFGPRIDSGLVAEQMWSLLTDESRRARICARLQSLRDSMGSEGAVDRAAAAILKLIPHEDLDRTVETDSEDGPLRVAARR
jgi:lipid-A-disaccharide synthase